MKSFAIARYSEPEIQWPTACAVCHAEADATATVSFERSTNEKMKYWGVWISVRYNIDRLKYRYPVCHKHKFLCNLLDAPSRWGKGGSLLVLCCAPIAMMVGFSILWNDVLTGLGIPINSGVAWIIHMILLLATVAIVPAYFLFCLLLKPVRIRAVDTMVVKLSFRSNDFSEDFERLNRRIIL